MTRFRHRPHANPLSDNDFQLPCTAPESFPFAEFYPVLVQRKAADACSSILRFDLVDIGCGYGDFVLSIGRVFSDLLIIGLEIRDIPVALGQQAILDSRQEGENQNTAIVRFNVMKHLPRLLTKNSVRFFTIMFPDPQFKLSHVRRRVISSQLLSEYAYYLVPGGFLLVCTDLKELYEYMHNTIVSHPMYHEVTVDELTGNGRFSIDTDTLRIIDTILEQMHRTADAERHMRKDDDKTIYKGIFQRIFRV